jgi:CubicO group peptidase (beta-lactamase class C family)
MRRDLSPREIVALIADLPLHFPPGSQWAYSNTNYTVLGLIIEQLAGVPWERYVTEHLLVPAGMTATSRCLDAPLVEHRARGYVVDGASLQNAPYRSATLPYASGGLCGTASDLVRWRLAMDREAVLDPKSRGEMESVHTPAGSPLAYGYGVFIDRVAGHRDVHHEGEVPGFEGELHDLQDDRVIVSVLGNTNSDAVRLISVGLVYELVGAPIRDVPLSQADAGLIAGDYTLPDGSAVKVMARGSQLLVQRGDLSPLKLRHQGNFRFIVAPLPTIEYTFTVTGRVLTRAERRQGGTSEALVRKR